MDKTWTIAWLTNSSAVEIDLTGLTRGDLENEGLSANEIMWILANSEVAK